MLKNIWTRPSWYYRHCMTWLKRQLNGSVKELSIWIYFFFPPITQWCSISDVLFTGGRGVSDFSVLKYYLLNINSVNKLNECILIDCSQPTTTCCSVLPPEIIMHDDTYIGRCSENNIKCVMHDDLGWKNQTTRHILPHHWLYE